MARLKSIFVEEREYEGLRDQNKRLELTDRVLRKAWKRKLAAPGRSESEFWQNEFGTPVGARILTWKGIELMSERIREDKKARREVWIGRIKILAYVVGIVGGLWAFLERLL